MDGNSSPKANYQLILPFIAAVCGVAALFALPVAGFGTRIGLWGFRTGLAIFKYAGYGGFFSSLLALAALAISFKKKQVRANIISLAALVCALFALALPLSWQSKAHRVPRIHDISTDLNNPPRFVALAPFHPSGYEGAAIASLQLQAYPDLKTLVLPLPDDSAYRSALDTARDMGWDLAAAIPAEGRIEATDTTFWFGFKDDVVIRITPAGDRSLLDIRSVSRVGVSDLGTNAKRIRTFLAKISHQGK